MGIVQTIALSMGAAWGSGINLYAAVFTLGFLQNTNQIVLPPDLEVLGNPLVMAAAGLMYLVEFFADKVPGVDTLWDTIHSFIRIPAGAVLAAGAVGDLGTGAQLAALLVGGSLTAATHATKAGTRAMVNVSPEPFSNWALSIGEDIAVITGVWAALKHPWLFLVLLILFILFMAWVLPKLWRGIKRVFRWLFRSGAGVEQKPAAQTTQQATAEASQAPPTAGTTGETGSPSASADKPPDSERP